MFKVTFPTTNTCPNTLSYLYDGHSWTEYASNFVIIFKYVLEFWSLCMPCSHVEGPPCQYNTWEPTHPTIAAHFDKNNQRNRPCIEILLQNIFEDNDEIRRIFNPRVTVIEIRKRVRACIRRRE
ncbi:hypothetical protein SFRURICE_001494, partial [Spodoptera frugiperda]